MLMGVFKGTQYTFCLCVYLKGIPYIFVIRLVHFIIDAVGHPVGIRHTSAISRCIWGGQLIMTTTVCCRRLPGTRK